MGFFFGFLCGLLFIPLSILAGLYYFFTYSESYAKKRQREIDEVKLKELELRNELEDAAQYASYLSSTHNQTGNSAHGGSGAVPEHLDPHYQFAGWISVRRIPEVDHRIIEPSAKKETKRSLGKNGKGSSSSLMDDGNYGQGVGVGAATQDPRLAYLDTQNLHLTLPPCLQARFKDSKYGVIKGSVMFIYDNEHLHECLGVITLTNYEISVPGHPTDGHMFAKRYPIWLKYQHISHHSSHQGRNSTDSGTNSSKDYYLSMVNCVDKEDLYFTLLRCSKLKPNSRSFLREIPKRDSTQFDKSNMNTLIRSIHSNEHQFHMAWLNALLGRIFLGVYKTPKIKDAIYQKLVDKLSRIRLPNFVNHLRLKSVHLGDGVPMITRPKLLSLKPNGDMVMDMNLLYQGGFRAEIEAEAVVAVTKKMPIKVSLVLVVTLDRLEGRLQAWIKPPPSNRIWYGFYHRPQVEMKIEPVVSDKHIKSNLIIKAIENKLMEAISETFVLPNMDDVSFFDSDGIGGIFGEEISPGGEPKQATTQPGAKTQSNNHNLEPRAATFSLGDSVNTPRSAIDLSSDLRHHETMPAGLYRVPLAARSHGSLGDEIMQANYTYDVRNKTGLSPDDDPMRSGTPKVGQTSDNAGPKTLHVPGSRGIKVNTDQGPKSQDQESPNSCNNRLLNRMYHSNTAELKRGRRGSLDPNVNLSYSTATPAGNNPNSAHFPAMDEARKMEEHWSQYGISEYDPLAGQKKKVKGKGSDSPDGDHASVHSKDSGDSGSTHTENTGHSSTLFGHSNSSHSTFDTNSMSHSSKPDKFSLTKMFNGFRKKHTKGANSGSSLQPSIGEFGVYQDDGHEGGSILAGDDESTIQEHDGSIYTPPEQDDPRPSEHLAENLQSGDDIEAQASFADKVQEEYEKRDSPPPFVYAASLFGDEAPHHGKLSPTQSNQNSLSNFGTAIRNLRNRSRASSASSREGLSILSEDSDVVFGHDLSHQTRGLTEADSSSQIGLQTTDGIDDRAITERSGSDEYPNGQSLEEPELPSIYESPLVEKEQLTRDSRRKSISVPKLQSGFDYPGQSASARMTATPLIVLQMPSPHGDKLFDTDGYYGRASMDETRLKQSTPDRQLQVLHGNSTSSPVDSDLDSSIKPRRHSLNQASIMPTSSSSSTGYTVHRHIHVQSHGVGSMPTSPLRNEFNRDGNEIYHAATTINRATGESTRNSSETLSTFSTTSSLPSYNPTDSHARHHHHQHGIRNIFSSMGHFGKHKHSMNPNTQVPMEQDPYSNNVDYDVDEVLEMNQAYTTQGMNDDPFTYTEDVDELAGRRGSLQSNVHTSLHLRASSISPSQSVADTVGKLGGGLGSLLESLASTPTQSIMGKAVALDIDFRQEALHARPGHVGEFPTPVRIHSLLDKEEKEVLALKDIVECNVDQAVEVDRDGLPPAQYISLSHPVPHSSDSLTVKGASMPLPEPEPIPASSSGDDIPEGVPFMPLEKITDGPPKDVDVYDVVEQNDENSVPNVPPGLSHEQSASDGSGQTITRREYEMTTKNRESIQLDPSIEEPSLEKYSPEGPSYVKPSFEEPSVEEPLSEKSSLRGQSIEERSTEGHSQYLPDQRPSVEEGHPEMDQFQPSTPASTSSTPSSKKSHHRNIFKRLIRRKSDDSLKDQAVYKSPSMSESQSSVLSPSSGSVSPRALGFFQRHHNNKNNQQQQQQQQQKEEYRKLDPNHPHGHEYEEHSTLQVPEKFMPDAARPRSNSSGNLAKEELTRVRSRPRSSTIHN